MHGLREKLLQEQEHLMNILKLAEESLSDAPEGYLRISKDKGRVRYYHCVDDRVGIYISKKDQLLPKRLAQKTYDNDIIKKVQLRLRQIEKLLAGYSDDEIEQVYSKLNDERKSLIIPVEQSYDQQLEQWRSQSYHGKEFQEGTPVIVSDKGERVRSKSEKIIADWLFRNRIIYLYEKPLNLKGFGIVYPDFTFLSRKTGQEIYWEHEGMMDNPEYAKAAVKKIELYEKNEIYPGEKLILTFETATSAISTDLIKNLTSRYLL